MGFINVNFDRHGVPQVSIPEHILVWKEPADETGKGDYVANLVRGANKTLIVVWHGRDWNDFLHFAATVDVPIVYNDSVHDEFAYDPATGRNVVIFSGMLGRNVFVNEGDLMPEEVEDIDDESVEMKRRRLLRRVAAHDRRIKRESAQLGLQ